MSRNVSIQDVVRAQVALLFGKFRPAGGLSPEEQGALRAERVEFGDRLCSMVRAIDAPEPAVIEQVRNVTREVYADERQRNLPTVESLCALVKRSFQTRTRGVCLGCVEGGGSYMNASPDEPLGRKWQGEVEYAKVGWLCLIHHHAVVWYTQREKARRGIESIAGCVARDPGPPPFELRPRLALTAPADDPNWASWTDGANMGPLARWAREFVKRVSGYDVGATETPLLGEQVAAAPTGPEREEWRSV